MGYLESAGSHTRFDTNLKDNMKGFCKTAHSQKVTVILFPRTGLEKKWFETPPLSLTVISGYLYLCCGNLPKYVKICILKIQHDGFVSK